ncbi:hypothetical protein CLV32_0852 [Pedobacter duraquae]|uniref:Uncharacterized protein n=1 Tax=Pedobacter duraquae TaxID=425511 RepID=A0A4R6IQJ4_9SPHI|nr:hypothetical protein CLV32_0852 [Pedobacter duraquae]
MKNTNNLSLSQEPQIRFPLCQMITGNSPTHENGLLKKEHFGIFLENLHQGSTIKTHATDQYRSATHGLGSTLELDYLLAISG